MLEGAWDFCQSTRHTYALLPNVYASGSLLCVVGWTLVCAMHESLGLLRLVGDVRHCTQMCAQKSYVLSGDAQASTMHTATQTLHPNSNPQAPNHADTQAHLRLVTCMHACGPARLPPVVIHMVSYGRTHTPPTLAKACPAFLVIATPSSCAAAVLPVVMHSCAAAAAVDSCVNGHGGILRLGQALFLCCPVQFHLPGILSLSLSVYSLSLCLVSALLSAGGRVSAETGSILRCANMPSRER